jgi:hypothetical protein
MTLPDSDQSKRTVDVAALVAEQASRVLTEREELRAAYREFEDETAFWVLVDLAGSTAYRVVYGHEKGYIQGEMFLRLVANVLEPLSTTEKVKEIGDAVLFRSRDFREAMEAIVLLDGAVRFISARSEEAEHNMAIKGAVTHGKGKRLNRPEGIPYDYLGQAIDRLARIASYTVGESNLLLDSAVVDAERDKISEYEPALELGHVQLLPTSHAKGFADPVRFYPLIVHHGRLPEFRDYFYPWRS